jgi:uncharacterized protein (TIGR02246 family)
MMMMKLHRLAWKPVLVGCVLGLLLLAPCQALQGQDASTAIRKVLAGQATAWNRGDLAEFMSGYKNSPDTTFIGKSVQQGWQNVLERYQKSFPNKEAMGTLDFSDIAVRMLGTDHAVVTGKFHLARTAAGGGDASGVYSLVFEKETDGWKIILDHTN